MQISPRLNGLTWARSTTATVRGPVSVSWKRNEQTLAVTYVAPAGVQAGFVKNETHHGLRVIVNSKPLE